MSHVTITKVWGIFLNKHRGIFDHLLKMLLHFGIHVPLQYKRPKQVYRFRSTDYFGNQNFHWDARVPNNNVIESLFL